MGPTHNGMVTKPVTSLLAGGAWATGGEDGGPQSLKDGVPEFLWPYVQTHHCYNIVIVARVMMEFREEIKQEELWKYEVAVRRLESKKENKLEEDEVFKDVDSPLNNKFNYNLFQI